ncbi:MAG: CinA family nicotinamide mononucleotide deamidase-related protein [Acidobacteriota bacterium]
MSGAPSAVRRAAIVAVGDELLGTERLDTNSLRLAALLENHGVTLVEKAVVGDDEARIAAVLRRLGADADLVLVTGGLGPTADDRTRAGAAAAFGRSLTVDPALVEQIRARFARFGRTMPAVNARQAAVIDGAVALDNAAGTAPGQRIDPSADDPAGAPGAVTFLLPGVPREVDAIVDDAIRPWLTAHAAPGDRVERHLLKLAGVPESEVETWLAPVYDRFGRNALAVLARPGEVTIHLRAVGDPSTRRAHLDAVAAAVRAAVGDHRIFAESAAVDLETAVITQLTAAGRTVAVAESCTGGLLGGRLTAVAGSSRAFVGGAICYSNALKIDLVGVAPADLEHHGAVSEPVARALAAGVRDRLGADYGIGITGVAGPGGGSDAKPVGTVHFGLAGPGVGDDAVRHRHAVLPGDRARVRQLATQVALEMLRRRLARDPAAGAAD